jgi:choline dehydrogenase-like flavoprotein
VTDPSESGTSHRPRWAERAPADATELTFVIGSGFGGAVAACRLAQAGFHVHLFERGRRYGPGDFPALPTDSALLPDAHRWTWQHDQGLWDVLDLEEIVSVQAAGYGGGSLVYANVQLRPPASVFDERWPDAYRRGGDLGQYYRLAGFMLDAAPITEHAIFPQIVKADQLRQAMGELERDKAFFYPPIAVNRKDQTTLGGKKQKACTGCGACCTGCPETAKNTLDYNYLALAERAGAHVHTQCEVTNLRPCPIEVAPPGSSGWLVDYVDHLEGVHYRVKAKHVFLCAGSVHSTRLLARAELPSVKSRVGVGYFPGGDALGVVYDTKQAQYPSYGPAITTTTVHWEPSPPERPAEARYFLLQDGGYAQEVARLVGVLRAPAWVGRNRLALESPGQTKPSLCATSAREQGALANPTAPPSMADDVLRAVAAGAFAGAVPEQLAKAWPQVVADELTGALLLPSVVHAVIEGGMARFFARSWLTRRRPEGFVARLLRCLMLRIIRHVFGTDASLGELALHSMIRGADLDRDAWAKQVLAYDARGATNRAMLLAMGRDAAPGTLVYFRETDRIVADLDLFHLAPGYANQERVMADVARALGGELRTNPAWAFLGKPITVHNQGGCPMSDDPAKGVTDPNGKVHGCAGLYVMDGAVLATSVGVNPSATIAAISERNVLRFIQGEGRKAYWPDGDGSAGADAYRAQRKASATWGDAWSVSPPDADAAPPPAFGPDNVPLGVAFDEKLAGYVAPTDVHPKMRDDVYLQRENEGRPSYPLDLKLTLSVVNLAAFIEDRTHTMVATGFVTLQLPGAGAPETFPVTTGEARILTPRYKPYGIKRPDHPEHGSADTERLEAQKHFARSYATRVIGTGQAPSTERFFEYRLGFEGAGRVWTLYGYKRVRDNPAIDAWRDTSSLFVTLFDGPLSIDEAKNEPACRAAGAVHTELTQFLFDQLRGLRVTGAKDPRTGEDDPARVVWGTTTFAHFFFGSLLRVYSPAIGTALSTVLGRHRDNVVIEPRRPPWKWRR